MARFRRYNPILNLRHRAPTVTFDPTLRLEREKKYAKIALNAFRHELFLLLSNYGLMGDRGFTFVDESAYQKLILDEFPPEKVKTIPREYFYCDGAILVNNSKYSDLARILTTGYFDSFGLDRAVEAYWQYLPEDDDGEYDFEQRVLILVKLLRFKIDQLAHKHHLMIADKISPFKLHPTDHYHYKAGEYKSFPIYFYLGGHDAASD